MPEPLAISWDPTGILVALAYPSQVHPHTCACARVNMYMCMLVCVCVHTCVRACASMCEHVCMRVCSLLCVHEWFWWSWLSHPLT